jgi:HAD superfamily hydrolase (TIGR01509 family)
MIRGIFFDLYGTLFLYSNMKKAWADWLHCFHVSLKEYGLTLSKEDFSKACDRFFGKDEPASPEHNLTVFEKRIKSLCYSLEIKLSDGDIGVVADLIADKWQEQVKLDKDAIPVLRKLKESKILGLVSNFDHPRHIRKYLSHYELDDFFEAVAISGDVGVRKPNPDIFKPVLSATGLTSSEVAYVGDTNEDIEAANAAGMMPILINRQDTNTNGNFLDFEDKFQDETQQNVNKTRKQCKTILTLRELLCL